MLTVITPCSRPGNLTRIREPIPAGYQWVVVVDGEDESVVPKGLGAEVRYLKGGRWGNRQRTFGLAFARERYVYFLDDDNILHPHLPKLLGRLDGEVAMFCQANPDGTRRLGVGWRPGELCDTAQFLVPRYIAIRYQWPGDHRAADVMYFTEIHQKHSDRFRRINETAAYYNFLR